MEEGKPESQNDKEINGKISDEEQVSSIEKSEKRHETEKEEQLTSIGDNRKESIEQKREEKSKEGPEEKKKFKLNIREAYDKQYKKFLIIPTSMLVLAIIIILFQLITTGDFINKDVSLKGGVTITLSTGVDANIISLRDSLSLDFPGNDIDVRALKKGGIQSGLIITSDIDGTSKQELNLFRDSIETHLDMELSEDDYSVEVIGSSLGESFFKEIIRALIIAFIFMGIVVLIYFRVLIPSLAVILAAFSDIVVALAIVNVVGMKINTAGIAAFLMLIGYSVDTNILLSTKVLKRREGGTVFESILNAMKTGLMMTLTTVTAIIVALIFTQSEIIRQIMIILLIGLFVDLINTWLGNSALLRLYVEKKSMKNE